MSIDNISVYYFYLDNCDKSILMLLAIKKYYAGYLEAINCGTKEGLARAKEFNNTMVPTCLIYDKATGNLLLKGLEAKETEDFFKKLTDKPTQI